jgi:hypothetical protein
MRRVASQEVGEMPKEIITNGAFRRGEPWLEVGWSRGTYVQLGVRAENENDDADGTVRFTDLDRDGINRLIRTLRKARDQAYGTDA